MNFYDEAIEAKHQLQIDLVRQQRELDEVARAKTVQDLGTTDLCLRTLCLHDIAALEDADPYFWKPQLTQLVLASGQQLPETATFDTSWLHGKAGYWWFGRSSPLIGVSYENERKYVNALLWKRNPNGSVSIQTFYMDGRAQRSLGSLTWDEGNSLADAMRGAEDTRTTVARVPDIALREIAIRLSNSLTALSHEMVEVTEKAMEKYREVDELAKQTGESPDVGFDYVKLEDDLADGKQKEVLAIERVDRINKEQQQRLEEWTTASKNALMTFACGSLWLKQKIVTVAQAPLERAAERRLRRANTPLKCLVVELRRKQYAHMPTGEHHSVDWAYQWAVRGHWRDQPTKEGTKLIWIHPYIKGPEDKPLKPGTERVFAVTR